MPIVLIWGILTSVGCGGGAVNPPAQPLSPPSSTTGSSTGSSTTSSTTSATGSAMAASNYNLQVRIEADEPLDRVVAFELAVDSITATSSSGEKFDLLPGPASVEVTHLANTNKPLAMLSLPTGDYTQLDVTMSGAKVTYLDVANNQPVQRVFTDNLVATAYLPITIGADPSVLNIDMDLRALWSSANYSAALCPPVLHVSMQPVPSDGQQVPESGEVEHVIGSISSATGSSFELTLGQTGNHLTFLTDNNTSFVNLGPDTLQGTIVEIEGSSNTDGSLLTREIENFGSTSGAVVEGILTNHTDPGYLNMVVQDGAGQNFTADILGANFSINLAGGTSYTVDTHDIDMTGLPLVFDHDSIRPGQRVLAESFDTVQPDPQGNGSLNSVRRVDLQRQSLTGTVSNYASGETTGTATFDLILPADSTSYLTGASGAMVVHVYQRTTTDLRTDSIGDGQSVQVHGLLFYSDSSQPASFALVATRISDYLMLN